MSGITFCHLYANDRSTAHAFKDDKFLTFHTDPTLSNTSTRALSIDQMELLRGGLHKVDAVVHHPRTRDWSFFSNDRYLTLRTLPSGVVQRVFPGTKRIPDGWESLTELGFTFVDAFLPVPLRPAEFFVFSGAHFGRIKFIEDGTSIVLQTRRTLADGWPALCFARVDSAMLHHSNDTLAYFFSGAHFICLDITEEDTTKSRAVQGIQDITCQWPDLARGLYTRSNTLAAAGALSPAVVVTTWNTSSLTIVEQDVNLGSKGGKFIVEGVEKVVLTEAVGEGERDSISFIEALRMSEDDEVNAL